MITWSAQKNDIYQTINRTLGISVYFVDIRPSVEKLGTSAPKWPFKSFYGDYEFNDPPSTDEIQRA